jgi:hypothetical protein
MQFRRVISNKLLVGLGTVWDQPTPASTADLAHLATDELPEIAIVAAEILPGTSGITVEASEPELQALIDQVHPLIVG